MGPCQGKSNQIQQHQSQQAILALPYLTQGILGFNVRITNIKIKIDGVSKCRISMQIGKFSSFESIVATEVYGKIYIQTQHQCTIQATEEELRQEMLVIDVLQGENTVVCQLQINMYLLATGPQHIDYEVQGKIEKKTVQGKISFDFKMAQIVLMHIAPKFLEFNLNNHLIKENYCYTMKLVTSTIGFQSEYSKNYVNPAFNKQQQNDKLEHSKQILWKDSTMELNVEVPLIEVASSSIQICLWFRKQEKDKEETEMQVKEQYGLVCETYLNLNQMVNQALNEEQIMENGNRIYRFMCKLNNRRLWNHGIQEGSLNCQIELQIPAYLQQQLVGVRTDKGVQQGSSVVKTGQMPVKEISELSANGQKLLDICFKLQSKANIDFKTKLELKNSQSLLVRQITSILKTSEKQSIMSFVYKSQQDLFNAQKIFIDLAFKMIDTADQQDELIREDFYLILKLIINRGELNLNQVGFSVETEQTSGNLMNLKTEVGINYQIFLYRGLVKILEKLKQKSLAENERSFVEGFFAGAYFRIPEFREKIVASVQKPDDKEIPEWRSLSQTRQYSDTRDTNTLINLFDWNKHFYDYLKKSPKYEHNVEELMITLNQQDWQKRIGKRGVAFFFFLKEWCDHVDGNLVVKNNVPWHSLPGYSTLIKALLLEMKARELKNYPEAMKQTLYALLNNTALLNIVMVILFNKTNMYDADTLLVCLEILNSCFQQLRNHSMPMPTSLDQKFFMKAMKIILMECDHAFCVAKCIWMLYNNYTLFPLELKKELSDTFLDKVALKMFMHWSYNIRTIFQHFLLYRIMHLHRSTKDMNEEDLMQKYQQHIQPKKQHSFLDQRSNAKNIISDMIFMKYIRFMQLVDEGRQLSVDQYADQMLEEINFSKAMRAKLINKKIRLRKQNSNSDISSVQSAYYQIIDDYQQQSQAGLTDKNTQLELPGIQSKTAPPKIQLQTNQLKYLTKAGIEFDSMKYKYQKWRESKITMNMLKMTDEEKLQYLETFEVPEVKLVIPQDEKENTIAQADEW